MNRERSTEISTLLADYSKGNFSRKVDVSKNLDEIDSIIMGINMLGEELEDTTISKNIFENIFNSVSNILFIVNKEGVIIGKNKYGKKIDNITLNETKLTDIATIRGENDVFKHLTKHLKTQFEVELISIDNKIIYTLTSIVKLSENNNFLVISEDVTSKKDHHLQMIKTIINTQEKEQKRVADDLHDSLGQELSSIRMMISAINRDTISPINLNIIDTCNSILEKSISELRSICFNLMPAALESGDLITAINELLSSTTVETKLISNSNTITLKEDQNLAIYRVLQEFLNNSIKHSEANLVSVTIKLNKENLEIQLSDNGKGFNSNTTKSKGRGLMTMRNRIESVDGYFLFESHEGLGTTLKIEIKCKNY
jgi:signal transduction histidine kinase